MLHQELCVPDSCLKSQDLLLVDLHTLVGGLPHVQGVVHLHTGIQKALTEPVCGLVILCLCSLLSGLVHPASEDRLGQRCKKIGDEGSRIQNYVSTSRSPSERTAQRKVRVECGSCYVLAVVALGECELCLTHVRPSAQQFGRYAGRKLLWKILFGKRAALDRHRNHAHQSAERILHLHDLSLQREHVGLHAELVGLGLKDSGLVGLSSPLQCVQSADVLLPGLKRTAADGQLLVQSKKCIVAFRYCRDQLGLDSLFISFALFQSCLSPALPVAVCTEDVSFPARTYRCRE